MQGNAFLGAFFAVSSLLNEFGITPEQYREVVYKQYVKNSASWATPLSPPTWKS